MQMPDVPPRRDDADEAEVKSAEAHMREALGKLGTRAVPGHARPGGYVPAGQPAAPRRHRFAREGEVPVERLPPPARSLIDLQRELTEERTARGRAEQSLRDAQATAAALQAALSRSEQAARIARAAVEEREAAMVRLREDLARAATERDALLAAKSAAPAPAKLKAPPRTREPEPVRWWLTPAKARG